MISDGLTKGAVERLLLLGVMDGYTQFKHAYEVWKPKIISKEPSTQTTTDCDETRAMIIDLLEGYAGQANISKSADAHGLRAAEPVDKLYNYDLCTKIGATKWRDMVFKHKPLLIVIACPSTLIV